MHFSPDQRIEFLYQKLILRAFQGHPEDVTRFIAQKKQTRDFQYAFSISSGTIDERSFSTLNQHTGELRDLISGEKDLINNLHHSPPEDLRTTLRGRAKIAHILWEARRR